MAPHSSTLAWKIPWTEEPGRLQSTGSQRVGHDWATSLHFTSLEVLKMMKLLSQKNPCSFHEYIFFLSWLFISPFLHPPLHSSIQVHNILGVMVVCSYWLTCTHIDSSAEYLTNYKWFIENISLLTDFHYTYVLKSVFRCILTQNSNNISWALYSIRILEWCQSGLFIIQLSVSISPFFFLSLTYDLMEIGSPFF